MCPSGFQTMRLSGCIVAMCLAICLARRNDEKSNEESLMQPDVPDGGDTLYDKYSPDMNQMLGEGAYASVYTVPSNPSTVMKILKPDMLNFKHLVFKECEFAKGFKQRLGDRAVDCFGAGTSRKRHYAVMERATGLPLTNYKMIESLYMALDVLEQLLTVIIDMTGVVDDTQYFHYDLNPGNILLTKASDSNATKLQLIDYGESAVVVGGASNVNLTKDGVAQMYRWFAWEFLWVLTSHKGDAAWPDPDQDNNPWTRVPGGFVNLFKISSMRPTPDWWTTKISPGMVETAIGNPFFDKMMMPEFVKQFKAPQDAKKIVSKMVGELFFNTARASEPEKPADGLSFDSLRAYVQALKKLVK